MASSNKTIEWFIYHHNLFIVTILSTLSLKKCKFVVAHNYGTLELRYNSLIDTNHFLSNDSLTELLHGDNKFNWNYDPEFFDDGPHPAFNGKYFEGKSYHPNEDGHKEIARLIIEYFNNK